MEFCYISVDVEGTFSTDGDDFVLPPDSDMASLGACVIGKPWLQYYAELRARHGKWNMGAQAIHGLTQEHLRRNGQDPRRVMRAHRRWVIKVADGAKPVFCAKPVVYDWGYVKWYFTDTGVENPYFDILDGRDLYRRVKGLERHERVTGEMIRRDFPTTLVHDHHALHDSLEQGDRFAQMLRAAGSL